eukprot:479116-Rhodomonas_salina.1
MPATAAFGTWRLRQGYRDRGRGSVHWHPARLSNVKLRLDHGSESDPGPDSDPVITRGRATVRHCGLRLGREDRSLLNLKYKSARITADSYAPMALEH